MLSCLHLYGSLTSVVYLPHVYSTVVFLCALASLISVIGNFLRSHQLELDLHTLMRLLNMVAPNRC